MMPQLNICRMSQYTIDDLSKSETQHNQIYGGALAFSSSPRYSTIYASGVKTGVLQSISATQGHIYFFNSLNNWKCINFYCVLKMYHILIFFLCSTGTAPVL